MRPSGSMVVLSWKRRLSAGGSSLNTLVDVHRTVNDSEGGGGGGGQ
jgi:hypothetical protein